MKPRARSMIGATCLGFCVGTAMIAPHLLSRPAQAVNLSGGLCNFGAATLFFLAGRHVYPALVTVVRAMRARAGSPPRLRWAPLFFFAFGGILAGLGLSGGLIGVARGAPLALLQVAPGAALLAGMGLGFARSDLQEPGAPSGPAGSQRHDVARPEGGA